MSLESTIRQTGVNPTPPSGHLYLSGVRLSVDLRTDTKTTSCE